MEKKEVLTNIDDRTIRLSGKLKEEQTNMVIDGMAKIAKKEGRDPLDLFVNSYGGEYDSFIAIYDYIKALPCDVNTIAVGKSMSAAACIVMSGTGRRVALPNARFMLHSLQVSSSYQSVHDDEILHKEQKRIQQVLEDIISEETGRTLSGVKEDLKRDKFMDAQEAVEYGLIDTITEEV